MEKVHISSGGVIYRVSSQNKIEILLLHQRVSHKWYLPKGTQKKGEGLEQTALREIKEETGFEVEIEKYLGKLPSLKEDGSPKITHYFLMKPIKKIGDYEKKYDKLEWVEIKKAKNLLSKFTEFEKEEDILEMAEKFIKKKA